jgi:hypothetical protein
MAAKTLHNVPWRRYHDSKTTPIRPNVPDVICADDVANFIDICRNRPPSGLKLKAAGSHWSLSESTLSDDSALETNWPGAGKVPANTGLAVDMGDLISDALFDFMVNHPPTPPRKATADPCLSVGPSNCFFVHIKSGTRIYEAYSLLDGMDQNPTKLAIALNAKIAGTANAGAYDGPWAFATLGGAGGQTVFGALTTGTHGGDFRQRPISDAVVALHLVADGGSHYWIEPKTSHIEFRLTDDGRLSDAYQNISPNSKFTIIRDDDIFNAAVVGVGRFGVVVSIVLRVVPQYCLLQHRRLGYWTEIKKTLNGPARHHGFDFAYFSGPDAQSDRAEFGKRFKEIAAAQNRFLQIAINTSPHKRDEHRCGVTQSWFHPMSGPEAIDPQGHVRGRLERGTPVTAGMSSPYEAPDSIKGTGSNGTFLTRACGDGNFIGGIVRETGREIEKVVADNAIPAAGAIAAALAIGAGAAVLAIAGLCAVLEAAAVALEAAADAIDQLGDASLAQTLDAGIKAIEGVPGVPDIVKIMALRVLFLQVFESQQGKLDMVAISYAVMDAHDYLDRSCMGNAESIEIFFDARKPDVYCAFVDAVLAFEAAQQEHAFRFTAGYVSLRYMLGSAALIAPSQFEETVAIEISGLRDASGSVPFIMNAVKQARHPMYAGCFHWGQFNPLTRPEVEALYDAAPARRLTRWRKALRALTQDGELDGFSSNFTRKAGLEPL